MEGWGWLLGEGQADVEEGSGFKGLGPDHPADTVQFADRAVGFQGETNQGVWSQGLTAGKANAVVAEIDGPSVVVPMAGHLVAVGYFGKTESMMAGDADRAAAVDRQAVLDRLVDIDVRLLLKLRTRGMVAGGAVGDNMLFYRQKESIPDQEAGPAQGGPMRADALLQPEGLLGRLVCLFANRLFFHDKIYARNAPDAAAGDCLPFGSKGDCRRRNHCGRAVSIRQKVSFFPCPAAKAGTFSPGHSIY